MFTVDEPTAEAIRRTVEARGELAGVGRATAPFSFDHGERQRAAVRAGDRRVDAS
jgi:hypothetical protein